MNNTEIKENISFLYDDIINDMGCSVKEALEVAKIKDAHSKNNDDSDRPIMN